VVSLQKVLGQSLFLLRKTKRNRKASKFNHDTLGGLSIKDPEGSSSGQLLQVGLSLAHDLLEGHEARWRGLQASKDRPSWPTWKASLCNRTRTPQL
jgi:hypothetical protein